ncbi:hypothetical protein BT69DRAFT_965099 [Atractiella rhizophila]|nr:hypothetical protein BT69DRAFT_965099 [Atractiella rhizophila]
MSHDSALKNHDCISVWNSSPSQMKELAFLKGHNAPVTQAALTSDGRTLVTSADEERLFLWDFTLPGFSYTGAKRRRSEMEVMSMERNSVR